MGKNKKYDHANILFTSPPTESMVIEISKISSIRATKPIMVDFLAIEPRVFSLNIQQDIRQAYTDKLFVDDSVQQLVTFFNLMGHYPYICHNKTSVSVQTAQQLDNQLKSSNMDRNATLLVIDRTEDLLVPVLHDLHYQAMTCDLLNMQDNVTIVGGKQTSLDEHDPLWTSYRHCFFSQLGDLLKKDLKETIEMEQSLKDKKNISKSINKLEEFQTRKSRNVIHITLAKMLHEQSKETDLKTVVLVEQNMAVGEDENRKKLTHVLDTITPLLTSKLSPLNKMRLIVIYLVTQDKINDTKVHAQLLELAGMSENGTYATILSNLASLPVHTKSDSTFGKLTNLIFGHGTKINEQLQFSRYICKVKSLLQDMIQGKLSSQYHWIEKKKTNSNRIYVYMIGGVTYAEMRACYELSKEHNVEIIIGSTSVMNPQQFLNNVYLLK